MGVGRNVLEMSSLTLMSLLLLLLTGSLPSVYSCNRYRYYGDPCLGYEKDVCDTRRMLKCDFRTGTVRQLSEPRRRSSGDRHLVTACLVLSVSVRISITTFSITTTHGASTRLGRHVRKRLVSEETRNRTMTTVVQKMHFAIRVSNLRLLTEPAYP